LPAVGSGRESVAELAEFLVLDIGFEGAISAIFMEALRDPTLMLEIVGEDVITAAIKRIVLKASLDAYGGEQSHDAGIELQILSSILAAPLAQGTGRRT